MSINSRILDGLGQGYEAKVDNFHALWVRDIGIPPTSDPNNPQLSFNEIQTVYREYLTRDGDGTTIDARVTGTLESPINFWVAAEPGFDIYITSLSIVTAGGSQTLARFGGQPALTNGLRFYYEGPDGQITIGTDIKTGFEIVRLCQGTPAFTDPSSGAFIAANVAGTSEALYQSLDFSKVFGLPYGVRLNTSSVNKIVMQVRDTISTTAPNITTQFDVLAYGTRVKII